MLRAGWKSAVIENLFIVSNDTAVLPLAYVTKITHTILLCSCISILSSLILLEFQILQPAKVAFHGHVVKVVEGSNFQIVCSHKDQASLSESWTKGNVRKWGRLLSIMKLNKSHAGNYTCAVKECSRTITLAVLCKCVLLLKVNNKMLTSCHISIKKMEFSI